MHIPPVLHTIRQLAPRPMLAVVLALVGAVGAVTPTPVGASVAWQTSVGAETEDEGVQALAFLPNELWVDVGDSVTWGFVPRHEIHTLTFLKPGQARPPFQTAPITPDNAPYDGAAYVNSGTMLAGQSYTVNFAAPGDFSFVCLVHGKMGGTVHVRPAGTTYPQDQTAYDQQAQREREDLLVPGRQLRAEEMAEAAAGPLNQVTIGRGFATSTTAGWMSVDIARFLPDRRDIRVGDTITWTAADTVINHTVTFGPEPTNPAPASSNVVNGEATLPTSPPGLTVNSGFLKATTSPFAAKQFSVTFTAPGTYTYICALHDDLGMRGTIVIH